MTTLAHNLATHMANTALNERQLAQKIGVGQSVLNKLLSGKTRNPKTLTLLPIAQFFNTSVYQLMHGSTCTKNPPEKTAYHTQIPILTAQEVLGWLNNKTTQPPYRTTTMDLDITAHQRYFAITLEDSTMVPHFPKGTLCIITPDYTPKDQDFVIAHLLGARQVTLKQLFIDGPQHYLKPTNQHFQLTPITPKHRILGVMIQARINLIPPYESR